MNSLLKLGTIIASVIPNQHVSINLNSSNIILDETDTDLRINLSNYIFKMSRGMVSQEEANNIANSFSNEQLKNFKNVNPNSSEFDNQARSFLFNNSKLTNTSNLSNREKFALNLLPSIAQSEIDINTINSIKNEIRKTNPNADLSAFDDHISDIEKTLDSFTNNLPNLNNLNFNNYANLFRNLLAADNIINNRNNYLDLLNNEKIKQLINKDFSDIDSKLIDSALINGNFGKILPIVDTFKNLETYQKIIIIISGIFIFIIGSLLLLLFIRYIKNKNLKTSKGMKILTGILSITMITMSIGLIILAIVGGGI